MGARDRGQQADGVSDAVVNLSSERATIHYDPEIAELKDFINRIDRAGYGVARGEIEILIQRLSDDSDARLIERSLVEIEGVVNANVNPTNGRASIEFIPSVISAADINFDYYTIARFDEFLKAIRIADRECDVSSRFDGTYSENPNVLLGDDTLILWNQSRMAQAYDETAVDALYAQLQSLAIQEGGSLISVEGDASISAAYAAWDADCDSIDKANAVAESIKSAFIDPRAPTYTIIVGSDEMLPFYRVPDETIVGHESGYLADSKIILPTGPDDFDSPLFWSLYNGYILTDSFYADDDPLPWRGRQLFIPDRAIGRLVENPVEIVQTVANYTGLPTNINSCT